MNDHTATEPPQASPAVGAQVDRRVRPEPGAEVLHLYAQAFWHDAAYIGGGRAALLALRDAINDALHKGDGSAEASTSDGEVYTVHVVAMSDEDAMRQLVPYTDECAAESRPWSQLFGPWVLLRPNASLSRGPEGDFGLKR